MQNSKEEEEDTYEELLVKKNIEIKNLKTVNT